MPLRKPDELSFLLFHVPWKVPSYQSGGLFRKIVGIAVAYEQSSRKPQRKTDMSLYVFIIASPIFLLQCNEETFLYKRVSNIFV
jgi:hypothetical protein